MDDLPVGEVPAVAMCGISGFLNVSGAVIQDPVSAVESMNASLTHRGPDDVGTWCDPTRGVYLGHRRLSILDLTPAGHQPMRTARGTTIVFNGEIYNFRELRAELPGRSFASESDTEVLLHLYDRYGSGILEKLNGMFAFAIWDPERSELLLARDRIGIKPLYFTRRNGIFAFASEIRALIELPWIRPELDEEALYHYLTFNYVMPPRTMFRDIRKLPPGHTLVVDRDGNETESPYWEIDYRARPEAAGRGLEETVLDTLRRGVRRRMVSDVPLGAFLSGGVDSSGVVALMAETSAEPVKTYSIGFEDAPGYDELEFARSTASRFGTDHHERIVGPQDLLDFLPRITEIFDEPLADPTAIPIYFISELARDNGSIVVLTGDGADEIFLGYRNWMRYVRLYPYYRAYTRLPRPLKRAVAGAYGVLGRRGAGYDILTRATADQEFFWGGASGFRESVKREFLSESYLGRCREADSHNEILRYRRLFDALPADARGTDGGAWMSYQGLKSIVPNRYLHRADRLGMANSIELRVPFLDHEMVELAMSIPTDRKVFNGEPKHVLKKALEPLLPPEILYRRKQGFCVPIREWANDVMVGYLDANLTGFCSDTGYFDEAALRRILTRARKGDRSEAPTLWNLYFLVSWFRRWLL